jgi:hypothetical protein
MSSPLKQMSSTQLSHLVHDITSVPDINVLQQQLMRVTAELGSHGAALSPLHRAHLLKQNQTQLLIQLLSEPSPRDYYQHMRLLLMCAHTGAGAILSGNIQTQGSDAAAGAKLAIENVPGLILKAFGKVAESIPLIGAGASALMTLIDMSEARSLNLQLQRIVLLARSPLELQFVIDSTARKLTVLQWDLLTREAAIRALTQSYSFRELVKRKFGEAKAEAMYYATGQRR